MEFLHKIAVVTGAAQGIGEAVTRALIRAGAFVYAVDKNEARLKLLIKELNKDQHSAEDCVIDVSNAVEVNNLISAIENKHPIDLLANVAGVLEISSFFSLTSENWERTFAINTHGVFYLSRAVALYMMKRQAGAMVTVSSNAGKTPRMNMAAYAASKAATTMLTKCMGLELAKYNVRCNVVSPGSTDTPMQRSMWQDKNMENEIISGVAESFRLGIPLKRIATTDDIARAVLFLLSDSAKHITMHELVVDGGATLGI